MATCAVVIACVWSAQVAASPPSTYRDGLVFLWQDADADNEVYDLRAQTAIYCGGNLAGLAFYDRHFAVRLDEGAFVPQDPDGRILGALGASNAFSLEATVEPRETDESAAGSIVSLGSGATRLFAVGQRGATLVFRMRGHDPDIEVARVAADGATHVVVTYHPGALTAYANGRQTLAADVHVDVSAWPDGRLVFGDANDDGHGWRGVLEGVAIYDRVLSQEEVLSRAQNAAARRLAQSTAPRAIVHARVVEASIVPPVDRLREYPRALAVHAYEVVKRESGALSADDILVARWVYLDRKRVDSPYAMLPGATHRLVIESFEEHPELDGERQFISVEELDLPLYYDVHEFTAANTPI